MASIGFIIALIYFIVLSFWFITFIFYFIWKIKPVNILPGTTPPIYIAVMKSIHNILARGFGYAFIGVTIVVVILFIIWFILKSLPWPLSTLSEIPPLNELREAGVFNLYERILLSILSFSGPKKKFDDISLSIIGFLKKFLIKFAEEYNPELAEKLKNAPGNEMPKPDAPPKREKDENKASNFLKNKMGSVIDKNIEQCIIKKTKDIRSDMSSSDILKTNMMNRFNSIQCELLAIEPKLKINVTNNVM